MDEVTLFITLFILLIFVFSKGFRSFGRNVRKYDALSSSRVNPHNKNYKAGYKTKAETEAVIKEKIIDLPKVRVGSVIDGDTVMIINGFHEITIRLDSIDCPEDGQYWGDTAKYGLIKMIGGQKVHIEEHGEDGHGRTLATIYIWNKHRSEWNNINERMVMLGDAWVMRKFYDHLPKDRQDKLNRLERWAKSKRIGLWHQENPIPPWKWRSQKKALSGL